MRVDLEDALRRGWLSLLTRPVEEAIRPPDTPSVHASGPIPDRLLLIGGGSAVGLGVSRQDRALPGHLARHLASILGRGVDLDLCVRVGMTVADAKKEVDRRDLTGYDGIVLTLATADALGALPVDLWRTRLELLLTALLNKTSARARILAIGAHESAWSPYVHPRVARLPAQRLLAFNRICRELCWSLPRTSFVAPLARRSPALAEYSTVDYERLGRAAAAHLAQRLGERRDISIAPRTPEAAPSPFTLANLGLLDLSPRDAIDRVVARTRAAFGADGARVAMVEGIEPRPRSDAAQPEPGTASMALAAAKAGGLAVKDLQAEPRFRDSRLASRHGMRFYAGHPIYGPAGEPAAVLEIFDPQPRTFSVHEMTVLRNHALVIQHVIGRPSPSHVSALGESESAARMQAHPARVERRRTPVAPAEPPFRQ